jgi:tetratricopeptide (TPR) repeat protein
MARYLARNVELQQELTRVFHAAGVPLMTGTDAPFDFVVPGFALHDELAFFVASGLTPLEALRAATSVPARFLGLAGKSGTVAVGAEADLLLIEADPLADISATRRVAGVFRRGRWLAPEMLQAGLVALAQRNTALEARRVRIAGVLDAGALAEALADYRKEAADPRLARWIEGRINDRGYELMRAQRFAEAAAVFRMNVEAFPQAANAWDSLGEACVELGALDEALAHYERALALDPDNENGRRMIDRILEERARADER